MEFKTQEEIAISYLEKMKRNALETRKESASLAIKTIIQSEGLMRFSTREKAYCETKRLNREIDEETLEYISKLIHIIYNDLNRPTGYYEEIKEILNKRIVKRNNQF